MFQLEPDCRLAKRDSKGESLSFTGEKRGQPAADRISVQNVEFSTFGYPADC